MPGPASSFSSDARNLPDASGQAGEPNARAARFLERIASLLSARGENPFRVRAYQEAAARIGAMSENILDVWREGRLQSIRGIGPSIAAKLEEFLATGQSRYLAELEAATPAGIEELLEIPGIGPSRARLLIERLGVQTPQELIAAAEEHRLRGLPGFGPRLEQELLIAARRQTQRQHRLLLGTAWPIADQLIEYLRTDPLVREASPAGSLRRMCETIGDIDLLAASERPAEVIDHFVHLPVVAEIRAHGPTRATVLLYSGLQVDLRVVSARSWGAALQYFTGSKLHNIALRDLAISRGLKLNEYGVFDEQTGRRLAGETEEEVYHALGLDWMPPELREDRGEIQAALDHHLPILVERGDINGDAHVHSDWSDGTASIEAMAHAARSMGLSYLMITDHSPGLAVARGLTAERFQQQQQEIQRLNRRLAPFWIGWGAEVDITPVGTLDLPDSILTALDYVAVAVHSRFQMGREAMTRRILTALRNPRVHALCHPRGRLLGQREGYEVDLEAVLRAAAAAGVAIEINGQPQRLDLPDTWVRRARELGCQFVIGSDAHGPAHVQFLRYGVAVARRGWLSSADILTTLPTEPWVAWLRQKSRQAA
ncbi:MAG: DNA polymerase/3'-5' exonuclease PolX [Chloroflexi bacterium]|nr:DNA polymerase/3'-5' exonuclease PolX [Chloroflexota bacterium]